MDAGERVLDIGGVPVAVRTVGQGPPVVLVHGIYVNGHVWDEVLGRIAPSHTCHVVTLPLGGHEAGVGPAYEFTLEGLTALLFDTIDALGVEDATLVANDSGGGLVLLGLGSGHPALSRIGRVVLTNCDGFHAFPPGIVKPLFALGRTSPAATRLFLRIALGTPFGRRLFLLTLMRRRPPAVTRRMFTTAHLDEAVRLTGAFATTPAQRTMAWLGDVDVPVTIVWGRRCLYFRPRIAEQLKAALPQSELIWVPAAGTYVPLDDPGAVAKAIGS